MVETTCSKVYIPAVLAAYVLILLVAFIQAEYKVNKYKKKVQFYEQSLAAIAEDMKINYALQQGTLNELSVCKGFAGISK